MNSGRNTESLDLKDAVHSWVATFDSIPVSAVEKLQMFDESVTEVTEREDDEFCDGDQFPSWSTMWRFGLASDIWWMESQGVSALSSLGFRVYESEDYGYIFGVDGGGFDFYEEYWIPLYLRRGLHWHEH